MEFSQFVVNCDSFPSHANSSLPSMVAMVAERHKELAGIPEHIKVRQLFKSF